jgi:mannose-6-phosphate isomerase-like protein (cupin superfamily)
MDVRPLLRDQMNHENGADAQRLLPWPTLNAPFEGSWCVVPAGGATGVHAHPEYEIFIAVTGEAVLDSAGERRPFRAGDIVHFPPNIAHRVVNGGQRDFEMYCIWWDALMSTEFVGRHDREEVTTGADD